MQASETTGERSLFSLLQELALGEKNTDFIDLQSYSEKVVSYVKLVIFFLENLCKLYNYYRKICAIFAKQSSVFILIFYRTKLHAKSRLLFFFCMFLKLLFATFFLIIIDTEHALTFW